MRDLQQPEGHLALEFRMILAGAVEAALWTYHQPYSVSQCCALLIERVACCVASQNRAQIVPIEY